METPSDRSIMTTRGGSPNDVADGRHIETDVLSISGCTPSAQFSSNEMTRVASPAALDSPPRYNQPTPKPPRLDGSAVLDMLESIDESEIEDQPVRKFEHTVEMIFLTPNDRFRHKTTPRLGLMDTGALVSITYQTVLDQAGLPFYYHEVGENSLIKGVTGGYVKPIGTAPLVWYESTASAKGAEQIYQTQFLVLPNDSGADVDFILGNDWLRKAKVELRKKQRSEDDGKISEPKGSDSVFFAARPRVPSAGT